MSALADHRTRADARPPTYTSLLLATLPAQITTGLVLWLVQWPFALLGIAPDSLTSNIWLPWGVDGVWSVLGDGGYVPIVCVVGGAMVAGRVARRGMARPAAPWAWLAFGASGYAAMALGETGGARLVLAVVLAPLTLRLFGYRVDGALRGWPSRARLGRRAVFGALLAGVLLALSYSAAHAFGQDGSAGLASLRLSPGRTGVVEVGLRGIVLPARITAVTLDGRGAGALGVVRAALTTQAAAPLVTNGPSAVPGVVARALPVSLPAHAGTWLAVGVRLLSCPARAARIDAITLHYRVLGITTSERIPLWGPERITCRPPAAARPGLSD